MLSAAGCLLLSAAAADVSLTTGLTGMAGLARAASAALVADDDEDELGGTGVCHGLDLLCGWRKFDQEFVWKDRLITEALGCVIGTPQGSEWLLASSSRNLWHIFWPRFVASTIWHNHSFKIIPRLGIRVRGSGETALAHVGPRQRRHRGYLD